VKGRPILGSFSGFFFGLFLGATLFLFGVIALNSDLLLIIPILGIVLGLALAWWAPFGRPPPDTFFDSPPLTDPKHPEPGPSD
jgi:hypothetical protein